MSAPFVERFWARVLGFVREVGRGITRSGRGATTWAAVPRPARVERSLMPEVSP